MCLSLAGDAFPNWSCKKATKHHPPPLPVLNFQDNFPGRINSGNAPALFQRGLPKQQTWAKWHLREKTVPQPFSCTSPGGFIQVCICLIHAMRPGRSWAGCFIIFLVWYNQVFTRVSKKLTKANANWFFRIFGTFIVTFQPLKGETREKYLSYVRQLLDATETGVWNEALSAWPGKQNIPF